MLHWDDCFFSSLGTGLGNKLPPLRCVCIHGVCTFVLASQTRVSVAVPCRQMWDLAIFVELPVGPELFSDFILWRYTILCTVYRDRSSHQCTRHFNTPTHTLSLSVFAPFPRAGKCLQMCAFLKIAWSFFNLYACGGTKTARLRHFPRGVIDLVGSRDTLVRAFSMPMVDKPCVLTLLSFVLTLLFI